MIFCRKKQRTDAKSGRTKVADWQDVGIEKSTRGQIFAYRAAVVV